MGALREHTVASDRFPAAAGRPRGGTNAGAVNCGALQATAGLSCGVTSVGFRLVNQPLPECT